MNKEKQQLFDLATIVCQWWMWKQRCQKQHENGRSFSIYLPLHLKEVGMESTDVDWIVLNRNSITSIHSCETCTSAACAMWRILGAHPCRVGWIPVGWAVYKCMRLIACARLVWSWDRGIVSEGSRYSLSCLGRRNIESRCCVQILSWDNPSCWHGSCTTPYDLCVKANLCLASLEQTQAKKLCLPTLSTCTYIYIYISFHKYEREYKCIALLQQNASLGSTVEWDRATEYDWLHWVSLRP